MRGKNLFFALITLFFAVVTLSFGQAFAAQNEQKKSVRIRVVLPVEQRLLDVVVLDDGQSRTPWFLMRLFKAGETPLTYVYDDGTMILEIAESEDGALWPGGDSKQFGLPPRTKLVSVSWQCVDGACLPKFVTRLMRPGEKAGAYSFADGRTWHMIYERDN